MDGGGPGASRAWGALQTASSAEQIGDVGEMTAASVSGAQGSASKGVGDARQRVHVVIAKVAIGAVGDGRDIPIGDGQIENAIAALITSAGFRNSAVNTDDAIVV